MCKNLKKPHIIIFLSFQAFTDKRPLNSSLCMACVYMDEVKAAHNGQVLPHIKIKAFFQISVFLF